MNSCDTISVGPTALDDAADACIPFKGMLDWGLNAKKKTDPNPPVWTGLNEKIDI